ncbi:hypothetical protein OG429_05810 [Streptomyces sp. NBC_00190]|uniref:hypothetical protein n=1 Tax=unclassified Streptomyces TaxID=2593676 RepID=UPI002E2953CC|nr:hypothetical protein [Streptomyces sp. NBC_00190]WSZ38885.1 hypothetical protein OG239_08820 [Streptomyces sp. NBC_00868]
MKLKPYSLVALLLTLPAPVALSSVPALAAPVAVPGPPRHNEEAISHFLAAFYGEHGPSRQDRESRVSQVLKDRQKDTPEVDVLLCAQNEPKDITVGPVTVARAAAVGWATVTTHWESGHTDTFTAYVRLDSEPIRLDDVICAG